MVKVAIMLERFSVGGAQRVVSELVKNLDPTQVDFRVLCISSRAETDLAHEIEKITDVTYLNVKSKRIFSNFRKVFKCLNEYQPDVINTHLTPHLYAVPWGILHRKPVIITAHTKPEKAFVKKVLFLIRWSLKHGKAFIVAVSHENYEMVKKYFGISDDRCCCINNGIAIDSFYHKEHDQFTYINVARQDENKNQSAILRCFDRIRASYPKCRLILLGDGPCHQQLCDLTNSLGLSDCVELPGGQSNVADYYARADVYVQSSHREAMPMSVLEAMASGLPIVSTDVGGMRDVVAENGYLVPDGDEAALQSAMEQMLKLNDMQMAQLKKASLTIVKDYSAKAMANKYLDLYRKMGEK